MDLIWRHFLLVKTTKYTVSSAGVRALLPGGSTNLHSVSGGEGPLILHYGDLSEGTSLGRLIDQIKPHEVYNLGAQSHVRILFDEAEYTADVVGLGALRLLESVRDYGQRHNRRVRYYVATGETHSVREFLEQVFDRVGLDWQRHVVFDPRLTRPAEVDLLIGDYGKARTMLGWQPRVRFPQLVEMMVDADLELADRERRMLTK
jgi:GDP-D-mannose dehydratase